MGINQKTESQIRDRISILAQLANADGDFDIRELAFIYNVSLRNNIEVETIAEIINEPHPIISYDTLSRNEKVDYMTDILFLMMIDGKILPKEIQFCLTLSKKLGFNQSDIQNLISELHYQPTITEVDLRTKVDHLNLT